jgi:hypothetical protein
MQQQYQVRKARGENLYTALDLTGFSGDLGLGEPRQSNTLNSALPYTEFKGTVTSLSMSNWHLLQIVSTVVEYV